MGKDYCAIPSCHNTAGVVGKFWKTVRLHHLPKNNVLKRAWLRVISRKDFKATKYTQICSDHFPDGDGRTWKHRVPSVNLPQKKEISSCRRKTTNSNRQQRTSNPSYPEIVTVSEDVEQNLNDDFLCVHSFHTYSKSDQPQLMSDVCDGVLKEGESFGNSQGVQTDEAVCGQSRPEITVEDIMHSNELVSFYTGLPDYKTFISLFNSLIDAGAHKLNTEDFSNLNDHTFGRPRKLKRVDEYLMVLVRLRLGLLVKDLEYRFKISSGNVSKIFTSWIHFMYECMQSLIFLPPLEIMQQRVPACFANFKDTRVVLDCTEIFVQMPSSLEGKSVTYSSYKSHNTFKVLVGISMTGAVVHVSKLWGGSVSDTQITRQSGLIESLNDGDAVMTDKGFIHIEPDLKKKNVKLYCPPFKTKTQFTKLEVQTTRKIASARIHVERKIEQIKNFRILQGVLPLSLKSVANEIFFVCAAMTNLLPPLVT